jgi:hypothetical protein
MKCISVLAMLISAVAVNAAQGANPCADPWDNFFVGEWGPGPLIIDSCPTLRLKPHVCHGAAKYFIIRPGMQCDIEEIQPVEASYLRPPAPLCFYRVSYGLIERCISSKMPSHWFQNTELVENERDYPRSRARGISSTLTIARSGPPTWPPGVTIADYTRVKSKRPIRIIPLSGSAPFKP